MPCDRLQTKWAANNRPRPRPTLTVSVHGIATWQVQRGDWSCGTAMTTNCQVATTCANNTEMTVVSGALPERSMGKAVWQRLIRLGPRDERFDRKALSYLTAHGESRLAGGTVFLLPFVLECFQIKATRNWQRN